MAKTFMTFTVLVGICCVIYQTEAAPVTTTSSGVRECVCVRVCVCVCARVCVFN